MRGKQKNIDKGNLQEDFDGLVMLGGIDQTKLYCFPIRCIMLGRDRERFTCKRNKRCESNKRRYEEDEKTRYMGKGIEWNKVSWMYVITKLILPRDNSINLKIQVKVCFPKLLRNILEMSFL